ncbi:MAG: hypothetical protein KDB23_02160 [Planctomycetales bacterium]|nr:hypothetical protein [Planctomycetales bacterium]
MNSKERLIATTVGTVAVAIVGWIVWSHVSTQLATKHDNIAKQQQLLNEQNRKQREGSKATKKLADLKRRALPETREDANAFYNAWLLDLVARIGFQSPSVGVADTRGKPGTFQTLRYTVEVFGTLDQLTTFLSEFYAVGDLHRIQQLTVSPPNAGSRMLKASMTIEALSLQGCQRKQIGDVASERVNRPELDLLRQVVVDRSFFFPANEAPKLDEIAQQTVFRGSTLTVVATASDPDPWDTLEFSLPGTPPDGAEVVKRSQTEAEVRWSPKENGEYEIELAVTDNGSPSRTETRKFKVNVVEPPPVVAAERAPGFDDASQTFLVGTLASGGEWRAWFNVRTRGDLLKLRVGDSLNVGTITGTIDLIADNHVEIVAGDARTRVRVGQSITDGKQIETPPPVQQAEQPQSTDAASS